MTDLFDGLPEPTPFEDGILFAAGATVALGALAVASHAWKETFRRKDAKERER